MKLLIISFLLVFSSAAFCGIQSCEKAMSQDELEQCLQDNLDASDKDLNSAYSKLTATMTAAQKESLKKAQKLWISFRDADCEHEASSHEGGSGYQAIYIQCQFDRTQTRLNELTHSKFWKK